MAAEMHKSGFVKGRQFPPVRFTKGVNPFGLGILYSIEFFFKPYNQPTREFAYVGITGQVKPDDRFKQHYEGAFQVYRDIKNKGENAETSLNKATYVSLGSAFYVNEKMIQPLLKPDILKIMNVVSLFDLGSMEKYLIKKNQLLNKEANKTTTFSDFIAGKGYKKNSQGVYGLNDAEGGEGAMEKQAEALDKIEWLFAAYYYIIEDNPEIIASREGQKLYDDKDKFEDKISSVVNQYQNLPSDQKIKYKIPFISMEDISKFVIGLGLAEKDKRLSQGGEIDPNNVFADNQLVLELEMFSQSQLSGKINMSSRKNRNAYLADARAILSSNGKTSTEEVLKMNVNIISKKAFSSASDEAKEAIKKIAKVAIGKARAKLLALSKDKDLLEEVSREGLAFGIKKLIDLLKQELPSFNPSQRFLESLERNAYKDTDVRKLLFRKIIDSMVIEIEDGVAEYTGTKLGKTLATEAKEELMKLLDLDSTYNGKPITLNFTRGLKETDISRIVGSGLNRNMSTALAGKKR